jgi:hypothetical protein
MSLHPGLKRLGYSVRPLRGHGKMSKLQRGFAAEKRYRRMAMFQPKLLNKQRARTPVLHSPLGVRSSEFGRFPPTRRHALTLLRGKSFTGNTLWKSA